VQPDSTAAPSAAVSSASRSTHRTLIVPVM
jgi:hypothetical protein